MTNKDLIWVEIFSSKEVWPNTLIVWLMHGNEIVWEHVLNYIQQRVKLNKHKWTIITLIGNIDAYKNNVRFINSDLNRSFLIDDEFGDNERKRAHEIMYFFSNIKIDYVFDVHSTPSKSDPMILCSQQKESTELAKYFPIKYVVNNLINNLEWVSLLQYFVNKWAIGVAFEAWCHEDPETIQKWKIIAQTILDIHNNKQSKMNKNQIIINTTDILHTSDPQFAFSKSYKWFEIVRSGEIRGKDSQQSYSFTTDKILMIPNTKFQEDLKKKARTWLVYFWQEQ